jgi:hypothetical protein
MSLFRIETCFVFPAALAEAPDDSAVLALGAADVPPLAVGCEVQAVVTRAMMAKNANITRVTGRVPMVSTETTLLLVR